MFTKLLVFAIYFCSASQYAVKGSENQQELIDYLIQSTFPQGHKQNLNYKFAKLIPPVSIRAKRETRPVEFKINDEVIKLSLTPVTHDVFNRDLSLWTVKTDWDAENYHVYEQLDKNYTHLNGIFYEDAKNNALMYAFYRGRQIFYDGVVGEGFNRRIIRSIPEKWYDMKVAGLNDHVIFEVKEQINSTLSEQLGDVHYFDNVPKLAKPLDIVHPKLIIVLEYNYFNKFGEDITETLKYLSIFWNAVNLKYREIPSPKVKIQITGIVIAKDDDSLDFILNARDRNDAKSVNHIKMLDEGTKYFNGKFENEVNFKNYDSAVVMTSLESGMVTGSAYLAKICQRNVIYVCDDTIYDGILTATHELGHSLGLTHDNDDNLAVPPYNSTILYPFAISTGKYYWSQHSLDQLKAFATTTYAKCLEHPYRN